MKYDYEIESDNVSKISGVEANGFNQSALYANSLHVAKGDNRNLEMNGSPFNRGVPLKDENYDVTQSSIQGQKDFSHVGKISLTDVPKLKKPDTTISLLYLSSDSHKRILERIETGKISPSIKKEWRQIRHRCFEEVMRHPIDAWASSAKMLIRKLVVPFLGNAYECLLKKGVGLALDFTEEDRVIQDLSDEFNDDRKKEPYKIRYEKFFGVRANELLRRINGGHPRILHIAGHGTKKSITFVNAIGAGENVGVEKLLSILNECKSQPDLVFLATCDSCKVAQKILAETNVKATVGLKGQIKDSKMTLFTRWFYSGLMQGKRISEAIYLACLHSEISRDDVSVKYKDGADLPFVLLNDRTGRVSGVGVGNVANGKGFCIARGSPLTEIRINTRKIKISGDTAYGIESEPLLNVRKARVEP